MYTDIDTTTDTQKCVIKFYQWGLLFESQMCRQNFFLLQKRFYKNTKIFGEPINHGNNLACLSVADMSCLILCQIVPSFHLLKLVLPKVSYAMGNTFVCVHVSSSHETCNCNNRNPTKHGQTRLICNRQPPDTYINHVQIQMSVNPLLSLTKHIKVRGKCCTMNIDCIF